MRISVKIAKLFMNMLSSKPSYDTKYFKQELFRHPNFKHLNDEGKNKLMVEWVDQACLRASKKPFEQYYPDFSFKNYLINKTVLDLGCSIGGKTFYFAEKYHIKSIYGIDVDTESITAANSFLQYKTDLKTRYDFRCAYAEDLPFEILAAWRALKDLRLAFIVALSPFFGAPACFEPFIPNLISLPSLGRPSPQALTTWDLVLLSRSARGLLQDSFDLSIFSVYIS